MRLGPLLGITSALAVLAASHVIGKTPLLVWNVSPSVPRGLYAVHHGPLHIGDLVAVQLTARLSALAAQRRYLPHGAVLIKPVAALVGDTVCRHGARISVHGKLAAKAHMFDSVGRPLPSWYGCRTVRSGEVFLLSDHNEGLDSRYFGALPLRSVVGRAVLIWRAGKHSGGLLAPKRLLSYETR